MSNLLLELFCEDIPARMQGRAAIQLRQYVTDALIEKGLSYSGAKAYATPRRLALHVIGIPTSSPDTHEERKGPRVGAPDKAIKGFLQSAGLKTIEQANIIQDTKKGDFYKVSIHKKGRPSEAIISDILPNVIQSFAWPKSMRWGEKTLRWVRPLHSILCTFGPETEEPIIVDFEVDGIHSGAITQGHRFMAPEAIEVKRFDDYVAKLATAKVELDAERRRDIILNEAKTLAFAQGLEWVEDRHLLDEVTGLVEWPVVLMGHFNAAFLNLPDEVIQTTIRTHQKCFVLRNAAGELSNKFMLVSNLEARDQGATIIAGNERVIHARLSDAQFFWASDIAKPLDAYLPKLDQIVFHEKLGSQGARVKRIALLSGDIAPLINADPVLVERAAYLAKADLVTQMVGEFPELQGLMGAYYAEAAGEDKTVARAIAEHYKPQGPAADVPNESLSIAVALADKMDLLAGFWAIGEKPTGSKDPYALRRMALGIIRILLTNAIRLPLRSMIVMALRRALADMAYTSGVNAIDQAVPSLPDSIPTNAFKDFSKIVAKVKDTAFSSLADIIPETSWETEIVDDLMRFIAERLKVQLKDQGARHDLLDAIFVRAEDDDLVRVVAKINALAAFLESDDGANLLSGYRRANNIVKAEEKKDGQLFQGNPNDDLLIMPEEKILADAINQARTDMQRALSQEDYTAAMAALATLREPVDAFFEVVLVNADDPKLRENRLKLLNHIRETTQSIAEFEKIEL